MATVEEGRGHTLVEVAWQDQSYTQCGLAFGDPGGEYAREWPSADDVKDLVIPPAPEPEQESGPTKVCPDRAGTILAAARNLPLVPT
jgi:hypothetical protein